MDDLIFKNSPVKLALLALGASAFVAVPFVLPRPASLIEESFLWFGALFFAACLVFLLARMLSSGPAMRFSRDGFEAKCHGIPFVPWTEVEDAWTTRIKSTRLLCLKVRNPDAVMAKLSRWRRRAAQVNRRLGYGDVCLATTGLNPGFREMIEFAKRYLQEIRDS